MGPSTDASYDPAPARDSLGAGLNEDVLSYLPPPEPFYVQMGMREKLIMKTKENPFVPLGVIFTTVVLGMGMYNLRTGSGRKHQILMRLRIGGQAFAVFAMLAGMYLKTKADKSGH